MIDTLHRIDARLGRESVMAMTAAGRRSPARKITFPGIGGQEHTHQIMCGDGDAVHVFQKNDSVYVLGVNWDVDFASLEIFCGPEKLAEVFANHRILEAADIDSSLRPGTIIRRLMAYMEDIDKQEVA